MELMRCYKFTMKAFEEMLKAFSKDIGEQIDWTCEHQKIKLEGDTEIPFNTFAHYMVSIECNDHLVYYDVHGHGWLYIFGHKYK